LADDCKVIDLTDDFDFDSPECSEALQAMPAQNVVGYDEVLIALRIVMDDRKIKPQVQAGVLNDLSKLIAQAAAE
jgi:hypothetical protein